MKIPPSYRLSSQTVLLLQQLERLKTRFDLIKKDQEIEKKIVQKSLLRSALFSARIEGNPHQIEEITLGGLHQSQKKSKTELLNIYQTMVYVLSRSWKRDLTVDDIILLHNMVMKSISATAGTLRTEPSAVFSEAGVAIYMTPMPEDIRLLSQHLLFYLNNNSETIIPIKAAVSHYIFEKIHPFLDGNGRTGRLLVHLVLKKWGYDLRGLAPFEEYIEMNLDEYYACLNLPTKDISPFIEYFIKAFVFGLESYLNSIELRRYDNLDSLPPRRYEILQIIKDHRQVSLNFIQRRFFSVSSRLLRYDLKKLQNLGYIRKRGVTKGAVYEPTIL
jgi:Fic family protein